MVAERSAKSVEIINHTRQLLTAGGYKSFSYADLAERVNIRKASIHHYFPGKADLVLTVVQDYRNEARAGMAATSQHFKDDAFGELQGYINYWATCIKDNTSPFCICVMLAVELPTLPEEIAEEVSGHFNDLTQWLTSVLDKGVKRGVFALEDNIDHEARTIMATVHGAMITARALNQPEMFVKITQAMLNKLINKS